jgi:hypothetical protein
VRAWGALDLVRKRQEITPFKRLFADTRPCVFAPDPVSLLACRSRPILLVCHAIIPVLSTHPEGKS